MIRIDFDTSVAPIDGTLVYREAEHAFDFEPHSTTEIQERTGSRGVTSLALGTLQLEVGIETGFVLYPWGYHPRESWQQQSLPPVLASKGALRISSDRSLEAGVSLDITGGWHWTTLQDPSSGWVCVARDHPPEPTVDRIEFSTGAIAGIDTGSLVALWLCPSMIGE